MLNVVAVSNQIAGVVLKRLQMRPSQPFEFVRVSAGCAKKRIFAIYCWVFPIMHRFFRNKIPYMVIVVKNFFKT